MGNQGGLRWQPADWFREEKALALTGLLGFLLAVFCAVWVLLYGGAVAPDGNMSKAFSFNAALGMFVLSTAAIIPLTGMGKRSRSLFRWTYIMLALYSYFAETVQHFRGVNPRFVQGGSVFDTTVASLFAIVASLLVLFYLIPVIQLFRGKTYRQRPLLVLGIRYAMIAVLLSFAAGIWISVTQSRFTGAEGNIIWLHGFGFHALQVIPLIAWLTERSSIQAVPQGHRLIHIGGTAFLLGLLGIGWQTWLGSSIFEWSLLPLLSGCFFLVPFVQAVLLLRRAFSVKTDAAQHA